MYFAAYSSFPGGWLTSYEREILIMHQMRSKQVRQDQWFLGDVLYSGWFKGLLGEEALDLMEKLHIDIKVVKLLICYIEVYNCMLLRLTFLALLPDSRPPTPDLLYSRPSRPLPRQFPRAINNHQRPSTMLQQDSTEFQKSHVADSQEPSAELRVARSFSWFAV